MQRIYGFICAHSRTAALAVVVILGAEAAFIGWQKAQYDEFMGSLLTPGALAEGVLAVGDRMDDGIFSRRDRVHFTIASSLYSDNPSAPPLTLDFDVTANFGPFGLTGDIFVLNATTGSAKLLKMLEGTHPRLSIRWSRSVFDAALKIAASAAPFDMRLNFVKPGVGPISWRLAAPKPVECSLKLPKQGSLSTVCTAPALLVSLTDPAANISEVRLTRASFDGIALKTDPTMALPAADAKDETLPADAADDSQSSERALWYVEKAELKADELDFSSGDWRGIFKVLMRKFSAQAHQDPTPAEALDGSYSAFAQKATLKVTNHKGDLERHLNAEDFRMKMKAADVPFKLFGAVDDESIEETLDAAGPMHFELTEFGFRSGPKGAQKTSASGVLEARRSGGKLPETELTLSAQLPEPVLEIVDTIVRGARPDARGQSEKRFMTPKDLPEGRVWELKMKESRRGSLTARSFTVDNVEP